MLPMLGQGMNPLLMAALAQQQSGPRVTPGGPDIPNPGQRQGGAAPMMPLSGPQMPMPQQNPMMAMLPQMMGNPELMKMLMNRGGVAGMGSLTGGDVGILRSMFGGGLGAGMGM